MKARLLGLFLFCSPCVFAQSFVTKPDKMPEFPGGQKALIKMLTDSVDLPSVKWEDANEDDTYRKIVLTFTVDEKGKVDNIKVLKSLSQKEDTRFINLLKKVTFTPASSAGQPVKVQYTLPFEVDFGERNKY